MRKKLQTFKHTNIKHPNTTNKTHFRTTNATWGSYQLTSLPAVSATYYLAQTLRLERPITQGQVYSDNWITCFDYRYDCQEW